MTTERMDAIVTEYLAAKAEKTAAEKREKALAALILAHAGVTGPEQDAYFETAGYRVTISPKKREGLDAEKLRKDFPDILADYGKVSRWSGIDARAKLATDAGQGKRPA